MSTDPREYKNDPFSPGTREEKENAWSRDLDERVSKESTRTHRMSKKEKEACRLFLGMMERGMFFVPNF